MGIDKYLLAAFCEACKCKRFFEDEQIENYTDAIRVAVEQMKLNTDERNVLVTHQFVTGAKKKANQEDISVGGTDNVDASVFDEFDYVALGHIHRPQKMGKETLRYSGTPLKYSFSEVEHKKSVTIVELLEKGNVQISTVPLVPLRDMRKVRGTYMEVTAKESYTAENKMDYLQITLTDEEDVPGALQKLRTIYPNLMRLEYDNSVPGRTRKFRLLRHRSRSRSWSCLGNFMSF